jgi:protoporphyrinogen oxidase
MRVVILGAGPTGLGAAHRLIELGHEEFELYEASDHVGGLSASFTDSAGFVWDLGGHVQFSHYHYFQNLMDELLAGEWLTHERVASVWIAGRFVPYPLQHHLGALPDAERERCQRGLDLALAGSQKSPENFRDWILANFGDGIAELFMLPYNRKVWAYPAEQLSHQWVGERVARPAAGPDRKRTSGAWGPNRTFRFPARGGTGEIWNRLAARLPPARVHLRKKAVAVHTRAQEVVFSDGSRCQYDRLISTMPLDRLIAQSDQNKLEPFAQQLRHSSVHVIGVGLHGRPPAHIAKQCWMYFPGDDCPFYRATVFSSYSPNNVPDPSRHWSLMLEVSESPSKTVDPHTLEARVVDGLLATGLITARDQVANVWRTRLEHGYPTPTVGRDAALAQILPALEELNIYSRGRFGAWKYEVSNQDHSLMQGVEIVDRLLHGSREVTLHDAALVNAPGLRAHPSSSCPLCETPGSGPFFTSRGRRLKRDYLLCPHCALVWVPETQRLSADAEKARYDLHQNDGDDPGYRRHLQRLTAPLIAALPDGATGLDFGCGPSPVLQSMLVDAGYPTEIYDPFYAPDKSVLEERYDFIVATEVVEHLSAPGVELDRLWERLRPDGILALMTQLRSPKRNFADWHYKNDPTHIVFFAEQSLRHLASRWGAECESADVDVVFFRRSCVTE